MGHKEEYLDNILDKLLIERGEHPKRVRHAFYGEERELAKTLVKTLTALFPNNIQIDHIEKHLILPLLKKKRTQSKELPFTFDELEHLIKKFENHLK